MTLLLVLLACGDEKDGEDGFPVDELDGYPTWAQPAEWTGPAVSCDGTHGPYVDIWYNDIAAATIDAGSGPFADGAILVKAGYGDDGTTVNTVTAMRKTEGFAPDDGDWNWLQADADLVVANEGALSGCTGCHTSAALDHVLFPESVTAATPEDCP